MERTFCIIKPDAVARNLQGEILAMIQAAGLRVVAMKQIRMTRRQAEGFYAVHKERPFFASLTEYMSSGPVVCAILEGDKAISPPMRRRAPSARSTPKASKPTPCTALTHRKLPLTRCPTSSMPWRSPARHPRPSSGPRSSRTGGFFVSSPALRACGLRRSRPRAAKGFRPPNVLPVPAREETPASPVPVCSGTAPLRTG